MFNLMHSLPFFLYACFCVRFDRPLLLRKAGKMFENNLHKFQLFNITV